MAARFEVSFISLHYAYFIFTSLIGSAILYTTSSQIIDLHYVDALFMSCSAMVGTGLNVLDASTLNPFQQGILFALFILGHSIPILGLTSLRRAWALRSKLKQNVEAKGENLAVDQILSLRAQAIQPLEEKQNALSDEAKIGPTVITQVKELPAQAISAVESEKVSVVVDAVIDDEPSSPGNRHLPVLTVIHGGEDVHGTAAQFSHVSTELKSIMQRVRGYLTLSQIDSDAPGWIEYKARLLVSVLILLYYAVFLFSGIVGMGIWMKLARPDIPHADGVGSFWTGAFLATSSFANNGMSLIDASMVPFQNELFPLLCSSILILAGNTLFPCLLRLSLCAMRRLWPSKPDRQSWREVLDFTLDRPQNVCTSLYPTWHTWFLFGSVLILNGTMWGAFELASIYNTEIAALPPTYRVLDGLFQAIAVRGCGFSIVAFDKLPQGLLILYAFMMYISAFPVSAAISGTNPFHAQPMKGPCLEADASGFSSSINGPRHSAMARGYFVCQQIRSQFSNDIWWLSLAILLITVAESDHYNSQPVVFSTFNIMFEVVSAYSCVGLSVGYPGKKYAFCGEWHAFSKLLLAAISVQGRHRSLFTCTDQSAPACGSLMDQGTVLQQNMSEITTSPKQFVIS